MTENNHFKPLLGPCDSFQLAPFAYPWAWQLYKDGRANEWTPEEIGMGPDVAHWKDAGIDEAVRHSFLMMMSMLTTMDIDRGDDAAITFMRIYKPAEIRQYLKRLIFEEAGHTQSYRVCIENMGLPEHGPDNIYDYHLHYPSMRARVEMGEEISGKMNSIVLKYEDGMDIHKANKREKRALFLGTLFWHLIFEGCWFYMGLAGLNQHISHNLKLFEKTAEQFTYIIRDENLHIRFGINLLRAWMVQYPEVMDDTMLSQISALCHKAIDLENAFIRDVLPSGGILGYNVLDHIETAKYFVNFRLHAIGLQPVFEDAKHRFKWMSEALETKKEKNFFETRVTEYQIGSLDWTHVDNTPIDQLDGHLHGKEWTK